MMSTPARAPGSRRTYDHRLREHVCRTGDRALTTRLAIPRSTVTTWGRRGLRPVVTVEACAGNGEELLDTAARLAIERLRSSLAFFVEQHNTQMPHPAFSGQIPDEMYFGTAANLPDELAAARSNARAARLAANRAMSCDRCVGQQASLPASEIPP